MAKMNGKLALSKRLIVKWANKDVSIEQEKPKMTNAGNRAEEEDISPQSKIQAIEAKLQKMQDRNPSMDLKAVPGSSQLSVVQREARLKQLELINAKNQSRKPYKR